MSNSAGRRESVSTDPNPSVAPTSSSEPLPAEITQALAAGLGNFSLRELLSLVLTQLSHAERQAYLARIPADKGNGLYARSLNLGSVPLQVDVPRTRSGNFRPTVLPPPYQRDYPEETQALLLGLLASCRSLNAAKAALRRIGLSGSEEDLEAVARDFLEELELRNTRPLDPDLLALFLDAKYVEVKEGDRLRPASLYLAVGLGRDGKKRILAILFRLGRENLEEWKNVLRSLIERGLRRVLLVVHDDFSGLLPVTQGLFPQAGVQLCVVHLQRNAKSHLSKTDAAEFTPRLRALKTAWTPEVAAAQFEDLCQRFESRYASFIREIRKKRDHYLAFLAYPDRLRRSLSTTNVVEAVNGQLEIMRRNSGGYFQSEESLKLKLGLAVSQLEGGRWRRVASSVQNALDQFNALFQSRFEREE
jgi:putative transposase